jgi:diguanylate cyclase (GGDEF)-like protein/PAS domain S-box-containing protein
MMLRRPQRRTDTYMRVTPGDSDGHGEVLADVEAGLLKLIHVAARASDEAGILRAAVDGVASIFHVTCVTIVKPLAGGGLRIIACAGERQLPADAFDSDWPELTTDPMVRSAIEGATIVVEREPAFGSPDALLRLLAGWESVHSAAAIPLMAGADALGALALYSDNPKDFDPRQTDALQWFARAVASEMARRRELSAARAERRRPDSPRISRSLDLREVARSIAQIAGEFAGAAFGIAYVLDREVLTAAGGWKEPGELGSVSIGTTDPAFTMYPPVWAAREQRVVRSTDVVNDPAWLRHGWERQALMHGFSEVVSFPLVAVGKTIGAVALFFGIPPEVEPGDDDVLLRLGFQGAEAVLAARRYERARQSVTLLDNLLGLSSDAVIEVDEHGFITRWNEGAERTFGSLAADVLRTAFVESPAVPADRRDDVRETLSKLARGERVGTLELAARNRAGQPVEFFIAPVPVGGEGVGLVAYGQDGSAARNRVESLLRQNHALGVMRDVARTFGREVGLTAIAQKGLDKILEVLSLEAGRVYIFDSAVRQLDPIAERGFTAEAAKSISVPVTATGEEGPACSCVLFRQTILLGHSDARRIEYPSVADRDVSALSVAMSKPLLVGDTVVGAIQVVGFDGRSISFEEQNLFHAVADELAFAMHNAQLLDDASRMAITDPLTGLYNYRFTQDFLKKRLGEARRRKRPFSIIMADVDGLQLVNEQQGRGIGDEVLRLTGNCLAASVRGSDVVARYGGDEFILVLPETQLGDALMLADRLTAAITDAEWPSQISESPVTVSMGCASFPEAGSQVNMLLRAADAALFQAKKIGGSAVQPRFD